MQSVTRGRPPRRDPSPSYWAYKMQRLWLTPLFRVLFRVGLPAFLLAMVLGLILMDEGRRNAISGGIAHIKEQFQARPEFRVNLLAVEGASPDLADAVRAKLAVKLPVSSFDLDLDALRLGAETMDAVASAEVAVQSGGVLRVLITERDPTVIWRMEDSLELLDATGHRVAGLVARGDRADLPVIAGFGADRATPEALELIAAAAPLAARLRGLVRMGDRRWDMVLDRNQRIILPAEQPVQALERLLAMNQSEDLLARDLAAIDLRNEKRPVLRLSEDAFTESRRARGLLPQPTENGL